MMLDLILYYSFLLLHNKSPQKLVIQNNHHVMFTDSVGQGFEQDTPGMSCLSSCQFLPAFLNRGSMTEISPNALRHPFVCNGPVSLQCI